jgi:hypothetical protein
MTKYVIMRGSKKLSGFYPNGISDVFAFRKNDWMFFDTKEQAERFISNAKEIVEQNASRYGEKYAKLNRSIARNLKAVEI